MWQFGTEAFDFGAFVAQFFDEDAYGLLVYEEGCGACCCCDCL